MEWQSAASASGKELSAVGGGVVIGHSLSLNFFSHSSLLLVPVSIHTHPCAVTYNYTQGAIKLNKILPK